jgi:uroporphyrinogen-III synthase
VDSAPAAVRAPLQGRRIVVTRARAQAGDLLAGLRALGAEPLACPAIAIAPPLSYAPLDAAVARLAGYDWLLFTSVNGVAAFAARRGRLGAQPAPDGLRVGAIGPATAEAARAAGLAPTFVPDTYVAEAILAQIGDVAGRRILLPRAERARPVLAAGLRARGALVDEVTAYRTVPDAGGAALIADLRAGAIDAITFTSSSTVRFFWEGLAGQMEPADLAAAPRRPAILCIGPITAATARALGLPVDAVAEPYTIAGLLDALTRWFNRPEGEL